MARAIQLAQRGQLTASPNPAVGAVLVKAGQVIGEGWHRCAGEPHAERVALQQACDAGIDTAGATLYVSLEPCCFKGKTPACTDAILTAGISRVVSAMQDPNPSVAGKGHELLATQGVSVASGLLADNAAGLNRGFFKRMSQGLPFVTCKVASSIDGRTAMASGESQWVTSPSARALVQRLRARSCAIVTGVDTILADDPVYTVRERELGEPVARQPALVVLDSQLRTPPSAKIITQQLVERDVFILTTQAADSLRADALHAADVKVVELPCQGRRVDISAAVAWCAQQAFNELLLECGATLAGAFMQAQRIDELHWFVAAKILGDSARPAFALPIETIDAAIDLDVTDIRAVGSDWRVVARTSSAI